MNNIAVLVLGMHRSGTSALAGALSCLGVGMGEHFIDASPDNPMGYWEHADVVEAHERLLLELGSGWDDLRPLPAGWLESKAAVQALARLQHIVERDFRDSEVWAVKDPRISRLLPLWRSLLARLGTEVRMLHMLRSPAEVMRSLQARDQMTAEQAGLLWARYVIESERESRAAPRAVVRYEDLLSNPVSTLDGAAAALAIHWPTAPADAAGPLRQFLRADLRHHHVGASDAGASIGLVGSIHRDFSSLGKMTDESAKFDSHARDLDGHLEKALPWLQGQAVALNRARRALSASEHRLSITDAALGNAQQVSQAQLAEIGEMAAHLQSTEKALAQVTAQSLDRLAEAGRLDAALRDAEQAASAAQTLFQQADDRLAKCDAAIESLSALAVGRLAEIEALSAASLAREGTLAKKLAEADARLLECDAAIATLTSLANSRLAEIETLTSQGLARERDLVQKLAEADRSMLEREEAVGSLSAIASERLARIESLSAAATAQARRFSEQQEAAERRLAELRRQSERFLEERSLAREQLQQTADRLAESEAALQSLVNSLSWRATGPMRAIANGLRSIFRRGPK